METKYVSISSVKLNKANPRKISAEKLKQLVKSILCLPQMLELRPIVVDNKNTMTALGGNMRLRALQQIHSEGIDNAKYDLAELKTFKKLSAKEQESLISYWVRWFDNPTVPIVEASNLSDEQKKQFIIKDNSAFGSWDYDMLNAAWDKEEVTEWGGVDNWSAQPMPQAFGSVGSVTPTGTSAGNTETPTYSPDNEDNLPTELQGLDLSPDELPKIEGNNETAMERIIIVFPKDRTAEIAKLLGVAVIDRVIYNINDIIGK